MSQLTVHLANGRAVAFDVDLALEGPAFFVLGVRKSGSSLLNAIVMALAMLNNRRLIDVGGTLFEHNIRVAEWKRDPALLSLMHPGNVYGGFRDLPVCLADAPRFRAGLKLLMVRDPRDALVSEFFSIAFSHPIPLPASGSDQVTRLMQDLRQGAVGADINNYVLSRARAMADTMADYATIMGDGNLLTVKYEDYIFNKPRLIRAIATHFGWTVGARSVDDILQWADVRPATEDPRAFVRRVTPGDHLAKLRAATIVQLNELLRRPMELFGYPARPQDA
jgi:hypothetical protein